MIKIEYVETYGWEGAIRGMRNPMNSWAKSDSKGINIGPNDLDLMKRLSNGKPDDRKYFRQIFVSMDITAPLYWWKEMDTYKVGTTANSCSTMHKLHSRDLTIEDLSIEKLSVESTVIIKNLLNYINTLRARYAYETDVQKKKLLWYQMVQLLPSSYNQKRTWTANYEVLHNIYHARKNHKLDEWREFCKAIEQLPYAKELLI